MKPRSQLVLPLLIGIGISFASIADASESLFGYAYTTDLLPKGKLELEQWITDREQQANGEFHHVDMNTELEYGLTDDFQVAAYVNYMWARESGNSVRNLTEGIEIPYDHNPNTRYQAARFDGMSFEFLYRLLSPYKDPIGLAFYLEPEFGSHDAGLEIRSIVQKNFIDDKLVLVGNVWVEFEREQGSNLGGPSDDEAPTGDRDPATYAELDLGASYRIFPKWFCGLEFRNHNEYGEWSLAHRYQDHTAFFFGPNIHYASQRWWVTLSVLRQLAAVTYTDDQRAQEQGNLLFGDEHTVWDGIRLKVGYLFN